MNQVLQESIFKCWKFRKWNEIIRYSEFHSIQIKAIFHFKPVIFSNMEIIWIIKNYENNPGANDSVEIYSSIYMF